MWAFFSVDLIGEAAGIVFCGRSWRLSFSMHLTSYLALFRPIFTTRRVRRRGVVVVQTSPSMDVFLSIPFHELTAKSYHPLTPHPLPIPLQYSGYRTNFSRRSFQTFFRGWQRLIESRMTRYGPDPILRCTWNGQGPYWL